VSTLVPTLQPHDYANRSLVVHDSLFEDPSPWAPWLTFADDSPRTRTLRTEGDAQALMEEAVASLETMAYSIDVMEPEPGGQPFRIGVLEGGEYACEQILNPVAMQALAAALGCRRMVVGVPFRGVVMAVDMEMPREHVGQFLFFVSAQYFHARTQPLSPLGMLVIDGILCGQAPGMEESGRAVDLADPDHVPAEVSIVQEEDGLQVVVAGNDRKACTDSLQAALLPRLLVQPEPIAVRVQFQHLELTDADASALGRIVKRAIAEQGREDLPVASIHFASAASEVHEDLLGDLDDLFVDEIAALPVAVLLRAVDPDGNVDAQLNAMRSVVARDPDPFCMACLLARNESLDDMLPHYAGDPTAIMRSLMLASRARGIDPRAAAASQLGMEVAQAVVHAAEPEAGTFARLSAGAQERIRAVADALAVTLA